MWHWEASQAIRWPPLCFLSTEVVVHIFFGFWFGPPSPLLPFLYAVMQADVGLFCCVLLSLSPLPPDYIPTSRREEKKRKKLHMQYMDYEKKKRQNKYV